MKTDYGSATKTLLGEQKNRQRKRMTPANDNVGGPPTKTLLPANENVGGTANENVAVLKSPFPGVIGVPRSTEAKHSKQRYLSWPRNQGGLF